MKMGEIKALEVLRCSCQGADKKLVGKNARSPLLVSSSANELGRREIERKTKFFQT